MKSRLKIIDQIIELIGESKTICIAGHIRPDGDCIGSQIGLALPLRALGKDVTVWNQDPMPQKYAFLDSEDIWRNPRGKKKFDLLICTDCASFERLGAVGAAVEKNKIINIDHHTSNTRYGDLNWISAEEASTGELIFQLCQQAGWPITPAIADCLFTAVSTDTGSFQYSTAKPVTYYTAGDLVGAGADVETICHKVYQSFTLSRIRLLKHVYNQFRLTHNDQIVYLWLKPRDFTRTGANRTDTEGLIDHIRAIEPVVVAIVFEEIEPELTRISLRSKSPKIDVNQIAKLFGGGGHSAAAGAHIPGSQLSVQRRVVAAARKALDAAS